MDRRQYLTLSGAALGGLAGFAGCIGSAESDSFQSFRTGIEDHDLDVKAMGEENRRWVLEYYPSGTQDDRLGELGSISRVYAKAVPSESLDEQHRRLDIITYDAADTQLGSISISAPDARDFKNGEITKQEYAVVVLMGART